MTDTWVMHPDLHGAVIVGKYCVVSFVAPI